MPKNYDKPRYLYFLSEHDELVPEDYLPLAQIFTDPNCALPGYTTEEWCLGEKTLQQMRVESYEAVRKRFRLSRAARFDRYWNANLAAINALGLNQFAKLNCFVELAECIVAFQNTVDTARGKKKHVISFGVKKKLYRRCYDNLAQAIENGTEPVKIYLHDAHIKNDGNMIASNQHAALTFFNSDGKISGKIGLERNEIFDAFVKWCKIKGISRRQGAYKAMLLIMAQNPVDGMENVKAYRQKTDIETEEIILAPDTDEPITLTAKVSSKVKNAMDAAVARYNRDVENCNKEKLTKAMFVNNALAFYIQHLPLKYTDPQAYKEYMDAKKMEEYNNQFLDGND